jgi:TonB family protein
LEFLSREAAYIEGVVDLDVTVLPDGSMDQKTIVITKSLDRQFGLDEQAVAAAKQWRFVPAVTLKTGERVPMRVTIEMTFTLKSASWFRKAETKGTRTRCSTSDPCTPIRRCRGRVVPCGAFAASGLTEWAFLDPVS